MTNWNTISDKVHAAERISYDEGVWLFEQRDIIKLGKLAQVVRKRMHGDKVYFNKNRHINPTNVCAFHCNFCSFARTSDKEAGAYTFMPNQLPDKVRAAVQAGVREFHIVGGLHPELGFEYYLDVLETLKKEFPHIHLKAFTAVEIDFFAKLTNMSHEEVLKELVKAGLDSMPGGGAEIFHWDVRRKICPEKANQETWLAVHDTAHRLGLKTNATMLYGHIEKPEHRVHHMVALREQQDKSGGFQTFISLAFHPEENNLGRKLNRQWTTGVDDIKTLAISRLMLDNIPNIKAYWVMLTAALAQVALNFGANDMDGTIIEEHIYQDAGAKQQAMTVPQLMQFIRSAGYTPVERDTVYNELEVFA
ncbi:MAG: aminofutalosine synthase MqnE [Chloroflexi bacterium]|nr:aminofutalosine synthase MqnE [Chloroflexota bacterium]MCC6892926.1 aminofutalosine synthase MqnE [Anaerolineae bacterium]